MEGLTEDRAPFFLFPFFRFFFPWAIRLHRLTLFCSWLYFSKFTLSSYTGYPTRYFFIIRSLVQPDAFNFYQHNISFCFSLNT